MVGAGCFYRRELERACERVRAGSRSAESAFIDSRENLKDGRFRSFRDSSRRLLCSHLTGALVRPRRCALHLWGFWGSLPCALVAALPSFRSIHSWSSGLSTRFCVSSHITNPHNNEKPDSKSSSSHVSPHCPEQRWKQQRGGRGRAAASRHFLAAVSRYIRFRNQPIHGRE